MIMVMTKQIEKKFYSKVLVESSTTMEHILSPSALMENSISI
jgi:hypothetical protein